ncbi:MAG TPA: hypothetical protein VK797_23485 [Tepidisphaeraceae bacterium]|jgi:hypothetical protein|nr:hypothetical protein [Tepidisphaeraceae bacterium]
MVSLSPLELSRLEMAVTLAERDRKPMVEVHTDTARALLQYLNRLEDLAIEPGHGSDYRRRQMRHNAGGLLDEVHEHVSNERLWSLQ